MAPWREMIKSAAISGAAAGVLSAATKATTGTPNQRHIADGLNGTGQWRSSRLATDTSQSGVPSTLLGVIVQQLTSTLWSTVHRRILGRGARRLSMPQQLLGGAASAATAYLVDRALTPQRPQPVAKKSPGSHGKVAAYAALGIGVTVLAALWVLKSGKQAESYDE